MVNESLTQVVTNKSATLEENALSTLPNLKFGIKICARAQPRAPTKSLGTPGW